MYTQVNRNQKRLERVRRVRSKVSGTAQRPRLAIHRSLAHLSVQLIDDVAGKTLIGITDKGLTGTPTEKAKQLGGKLAAAAKQQKITTVVFDRAGYQYHGRVAAFAQGARDGGLVF